MCNRRTFTSIFLAVLFLTSIGSSQVLQKVQSVAIGTPGAFRSAQSGNWNDTLTWQYFDGSDWIQASSTPDSSAKTITVQAGDTVDVALTVVVDELVIESGGQVTIKSTGTLTVGNGVGTDLVIDGRLLNQGTFSTGSGATWALNDGAWFIHNASSAISGAVGAGTLAAGSYFEYLDATYISLAGRTYGNLRFMTASSKTYTANASSSPLAVQGYLLIWPGVTLNTGAFAGNITVQGNTTIGGTWTGSGSGDQGTHRFDDTFGINSGGTYSLATTGTTQGNIEFKGDLTNNGTFTTPSNRNVNFNGDVLQMIGGTSTTTFNNGFTAGQDIKIASGTTVQVASGKTALIYGDLAVEGTVSGGDASTSVLALQNGYSDFSFPSSAPGATISNIKVSMSTAVFDVLFSGIANFQSGATFQIDNSSTLKLSGAGTIVGGTVNVTSSSRIDIYGHDLTLDGVTCNLSTAGQISDNSGGGSVITKGNTTLDQGATFTVPLDVTAGTTTASGTDNIDGNIIVQTGAMLSIPSADSLRGTRDVTVNSGGTVSGSGTLYYAAPNRTFTNNGTVSAPTIFEGTGNTYLDGDGTWASLTVNAPIHVYVNNNLTLTNSSITLNSTLSTQEFYFVLDGCALVINSGGVLDGGGLTVKMQGTSSIVQDGTFDETLEILSGTTTIYGANSFGGGAITVKNGATLTVPDGETLSYDGTWMAVEEGATINGSGNLIFIGEGSTFENNGTVSVAATLQDGEGHPYILGDGTWSDLTIPEGTVVYVDANMAMRSSGVQNSGWLVIDDYAFVFDGGTFTNSGYVSSTYDSFETEGTVSIVQDGSFDATLVVNSGTTTTSGTYSEPIIVKPNGELIIPTGQTLTADGDVTVEWDPGLGGKKAPSLKARIVSPAGATMAIYGTISGGGELLFQAYGGTFTNNGVITVPVTFADADDVKAMDGDGSGQWSFLTIATSCSTTVSGAHTFTGAPTPFVVDGSVTLASGSTIFYGGTALQTVAPLTYDNLVIDNAADAKLGGAATVSGDLTMTNGDLKTESYTLTLGPAATIVETADYGVIGQLTTTRACASGVNQTFGGLGVEINASGASPGSTVVTRYTGTAPTFPPGIPVKRYFDIAPTTNTGLNATFVFRYLDGELNGNTESEIQLYKSTDGGSTWAAQGGNLNTSSNTITLNGVDGFSRWTAGGTGNPAPSLSSVSPATVGLGSSLDLVLTGTGFVSGVSTPSFGSDVTVNSFTVNSSTQITANVTVSPLAAIGARSISMTNAPPGGGTATLTNALTIEFPAPGIGSISPNSASRGQTLTVTVLGDGFYSGITTINFGPNVVVNSFNVVSTTELTATISIGATAATGSRSVSVSNSGPGGGSNTWENALTINNPMPTLTSVSPASGNRGHTLAVVLKGTNFLTGVSTVSFGPDITLNTMSVDSATQITVSITISPSAATGSRDVTVTHPAPGGGTATLTGAFAIGNPVPTLSGASPNTSARGETMSVTLSGTNFINGVTSVSLGAGITVNSTTISSSTEATVNISIALDAALGSRDISVTNAAPGGGTATVTGAFTVNNPAPTVASITPTSGNRGQTLDVTVTGTNFILGVTTIAYGGGITINSVSSASATQVAANVTIDLGATLGPRDITVTNAAPGGGTATLAGAFTITNPSPTLTSVSPNRAGRGSKINVVLTGTNFIDGVSSADFGLDITVNSTTITSATQMQVNISVGAAASTGARNVSVTNASPGGGTAALTNGFTVDTSPATGVENSLSVIPEDYALHEAYPNPFNPSTKIRYGLPERSRVRLEVYNMLGNVVAELVSGERPKGYYEVEWVAGNLPSGVYLVRLFTESTESSKRFIASRKVVLVK